MMDNKPDLVEEDLKPYKKHKHPKKIRKRSQKFYLLGYLFRTHIDWSKFRDSIDFAERQLIIPEEMDSFTMRGEAYLHFAIANERTGALDRALDFARHLMFDENSQNRSTGWAHLIFGMINLEISDFSQSLSSFKSALQNCRPVYDIGLELQVYMGLSELFRRLQDAEKSTMFAVRAYNLSKNSENGDLNTRNHRAALLQMAASLAKKNELGVAHTYCREATRFALLSSDQASYAKSIRILADICRKNSSINSALRYYETAMNAATSIGDYLFHMQVMDGVAKCLEVLRLRQRICDCRPLKWNIKLLELANFVGAKLMARKVHLRLAKIYGSLRDENQKRNHEAFAKTLEEEMDLCCKECNMPYGLEANSLEALPCCHFLHARCAQELMARGDNQGPTTCPQCNRTITSRIYRSPDAPRSTYTEYRSNRSYYTTPPVPQRRSTSFRRYFTPCL